MDEISASKSNADSPSSRTNSKGSEAADEKAGEIQGSATAPKEAPLKEIENGIERDQFGNFIISIAPTVFFDNRVCKAFPGIRGLQRFADPKEALDRIQHLLQEPISFERSNGHGTDTSPIWLWRGHLSYALRHFVRLSQSRCLLDIFEVEIESVAVWRSRSYSHSFVYVEVHPDKPVGIYKRTEDALREMVKVMGYAVEEYGLYKNTPITRACYDDGAASIGGEIVDVSGASLRVHYLTKYNFFIASKYSPINSPEFDKISEPILNDILAGRDRLDELCQIIEQLPRFR